MKRVSARLAILAASAALAGCVGPNFVPPIPATAESRSFLDTGAPTRSPVPILAGTSSAVTEAQWWRIFRDPKLTQLEARVADENLDVRTATLRVAESRSQVASTAAAALPTLSANANDYHEAFSANSLFKLVPIQALSGGSSGSTSSANQIITGFKQLHRRLRRLVGARPLGPHRPPDRGGRCAVPRHGGDASQHAGLDLRRAGARLRHAARDPGAAAHRARQSEGRGGDPPDHQGAAVERSRHRARCRERRLAGRIGARADSAAPVAGGQRDQHDQPAARPAAAGPVAGADRPARDPAEPAGGADRPALGAGTPPPRHPHGRGQPACRHRQHRRRRGGVLPERPT